MWWIFLAKFLGILQNHLLVLSSSLYTLTSSNELFLGQSIGTRHSGAAKLPVGQILGYVPKNRCTSNWPMMSCTTCHRFLWASNTTSQQFCVQMMTSNQCKSKTKNAASTPQLLSEAAKSAREVTMATIVRLVDDKAAKSGGHIPCSFYPDVI